MAETKNEKNTEEKKDVKETAKKETKNENKAKEATKKENTKNVKNSGKENELTEKIKSEATSTVNEVKDTIKKVDIKKDSAETKGFVMDMFKDPIRKIKEIVNKGNAKFFTYAIIILAIWTIAVAIRECFTLGNSNMYNFFDSLLMLIKTSIYPILSVTVLSIIVMVTNKENKKSLTNIVTAITAAKIPTVIVSVLSLLTIISSEAYKVISPISGFASTISIVLSYFAIKFINKKEKDSEFIKQYAIVMILYFVVDFALSFLGINI